jgi:hypothetical protein
VALFSVVDYKQKPCYHTYGPLNHRGGGMTVLQFPKKERLVFTGNAQQVRTFKVLFPEIFETYDVHIRTVRNMVRKWPRARVKGLVAKGWKMICFRFS